MKSTRKKRWSDYLWIAELCYLFLGLFNILFAWLGMLFFCIPLFVAIFGGSKAYCNRYCGRGQLFSLLGEKLKLSRNTPPPKFLRSPWFRYGFFNLLYGDVRPDAVQHLPGIYRRAPFADGDASVGIQAPVAVGGREFCGPVDRAVCLRLFRRYAHLDGAGPFDNGIVPAPVVVRILPDGNHDPGNLQIKERKEGKGIWKNRQRK